MVKQKMVKVGNLEVLKSAIIKTTNDEIDEIVLKAKEDARKLLDETLERLKDEIKLKIDTIFQSAKTLIESEKEGLETEKKRNLEVLKRQYVDLVYQKAWERVVSDAFSQTEKYVELLRKLLLSMKEEAGSETVFIYPLKRDVELVSKLIEELGLSNFKISGSAEDRGLRYAGGIMGSSEDGKIWYNYTLERVFEDVKDRTYSHVIKLLTK